MEFRAAASTLGIDPNKLRNLHRSGKVPDASKRNSRGRRFYSVDDLAQISRSLLRLSQAGELNGEWNPLTVTSLFSGIGGMDLGFERAGFTVTFQCEINGFCADLLEQHWPHVPRHDDIRTLNERRIPVSDVWAAGFPCQDVSLARMGKRDGLKGKKSGLFFDFARLVGERRPRVLVVENVAGLLSSNGGDDFAVVLGTLAELGYSLGWRTLNSKNFGVPQSRQRVYIVGCYRDDKGPAKVLFEPERSEGHDPASGPNGKKPVSPFKRVLGDPRGKGPVTPSLAYCLYACSARHTGTDWSRNYVSYPKLGDVRRLTPLECERVMAFPDGWTIPVATDLDEEALDSARYHALGNAVTPPVLSWIAGRIREYLSPSSKRLKSASV